MNQNRQKSRFLFGTHLALVAVFAVMLFGLIIMPAKAATATASVKWNFYAGTELVSSPAIGPDGTIYISANKQLIALTPTGSQRWAFSAGSFMTYNSPIVGSDGTIYIGEFLNKLYAINPDGTQKWIFTTAGTINATASLGSDGTIYITDVTSGASRLYAINPDGTQRWAFTTAEYGLYNSTIGTDGTIYVGAYGNKLYAVNPDGTKKWTFATNGGIFSSHAIGADNTIYIQARSTLYAINPDGTQKWAFIDGNDSVGGQKPSPAIGPDGTIYAGADACDSSPCTRNLYAVNPNGTPKWLFTFASQSSSNASPTIDTNGVIYIGSGSGVFYALNPDGTKKWGYTTGFPSAIGSSPTISSDGTIYFGAYDRQFYALSGESSGLANSPWPKFQKNNRNTGSASDIASLRPPTLSNFLQWDGSTSLSEGWILPSPRAISFSANISDPDGDQVKLQVELRRFEESFTGIDDGGILISNLVPSGSENARVTRFGLSGGKYHWRARVIDSNGSGSGWQEFGVVGNVDFEIRDNIDTDGDGVIDEIDQCINRKEDMDGHNDSDGCPEISMRIILAETSDASHQSADNAVKYKDIFDRVVKYNKENSYGRVELELIEVMDNSGRWYNVGKKTNEYKIRDSDRDKNVFDGEKFIRDALESSGSASATADIVTIISSQESYQVCTSESFLGLGIGCDESSLPKTAVWSLEEYYPKTVFILLGHEAHMGHWAHEVGHALGVVGEDARGCWVPHPFPYSVRSWDIMALGAYNGNDNTPSYMSSFTREFLGWLHYDHHLAESTEGVFTINSLTTSKLGDEVFRLDIDENHYYILEARTNDSKYSEWDTKLEDSILPGKGLGVYYIDSKTDSVCADHDKGERIVSLEKVITPPGLLFNGSYIDPENKVAISVIEEQAEETTYNLKADIKKYIPKEGLTGFIVKGGVAMREWIHSLTPLLPIDIVNIPSVDLHAYTASGQHIGENYSSNKFEGAGVMAAEGAVISGNHVEGREWIVLPESEEPAFYVSTLFILKFIQEFPQLAPSATEDLGQIELRPFSYDDENAPVNYQEVTIPVGVVREITRTSGGIVLKVTIESLIKSLMTYREFGFIKNKEVFDGLNDKLVEVQKKMEGGKLTPAINQLNAFKNQWQADSTVIDDIVRPIFVGEIDSLVSDLTSQLSSRNKK